MNHGPLPLFPEQASSVAGGVDRLFFFLVAVSAFFALLIFVLIGYFAVRYRARPGREHAETTKTVIWLEAVWTLIPLGIVMVMFVWGARLFLHMYQPPDNAMNIFVVGKQWMWKFQHPTGQLEINELHVPVGRPVTLSLISEDVIHSFFVPAFRIKRDVLPGRYVKVWFQATKPGRYRLFCAEYCGTQHSLMTGWVNVLEPTEYENWLRASSVEEPMSVAGARLFEQLGCQMCHGIEATKRGPPLAGLFGSQVRLANGQAVLADETYLRESLVRPEAKLTAGYTPIMPTYQGMLSEQQLLQLIAYLKTLTAQTQEASPP